MTPSIKIPDEKGLKDDEDGCSRRGGGEPQAAASGPEVKGEVHGIDASEEERDAEAEEEASPIETVDPPEEETDERIKRRKFFQVRRQFAQEEQDQQIAQEEHGERIKARVHLTPDQPTAKEIEQHRDEQHINFRSWCAECVPFGHYKLQDRNNYFLNYFGNCNYRIAFEHNYFPITESRSNLIFSCYRIEMENAFTSAGLRWEICVFQIQERNISARIITRFVQLLHKMQKVQLLHSNSKFANLDAKSEIHCPN